MSLIRHHPPATVYPAPPQRTVVVALPPEVASADLNTTAIGALRQQRLPTGQPWPYFLRRRAGLRPRRTQRTSGGPVAGLDLDGMRRQAVAAADAQWRWWRHVVTGTPVARPMWSYVERHLAQPGRYPFTQAESDYTSQPRILAMAAYNALPQNWPLPDTSLEAFQAGHSTYLNLAWLGAVCGDGLITADGRWRTTGTDRLSDQVRYLSGANAYLARLSGTDRLVALGAG